MSISTAQRLAAIYVTCSLIAMSKADLSSTDNILLHMPSRRATTCSADQNSCQAVDSSLSGNFCCSSSSHCISLDSSSSALCCPNGSDCGTIEPVNCDVSKQNATSNPSSLIFTTQLGGSLQTCGSACCPFGYTCSSANTCIIDAESAIGANITQPVSTSSTSSATSTSTAAPSVTSLPSSQNSTTPITKSSSFSGGSFAAGFFPGILIGALITLAWVIFTGRHKHPSSRASTHSSISYHPHKPVISAPMIVDAQTPPSGRTDFLRRTTSRARSVFSHGNPPTTSSDEDWRNVKIPTPPKNNNIPSQSYGQTVPVTPERRVARHEPSTESIRVYSPPSMIHPPITSIIPLRGMASQRNMTSQYPPTTETGTGLVSPFTSPPATNPTTNINRATSISPPTPISEQRQETLTPARYETSAPTGGSRNKGKNKALAQGIADGIRQQGEGTRGQSEFLHGQPQGNRGQQGNAPMYRPQGDPPHVGVAGSDTSGNGSSTRPTTTFTDMLHQINFPDPGRVGVGGTPRMPPVPKGYGGGRYT